jgi:galactose mutarotase-like enzyme
MRDGEPLTIRCEGSHKGDGPRFESATFLPARGMNLFQARGVIPGLGEVELLHSPAPGDAASVPSFSFGGAFLVPFANRIRGRLSADGISIDTDVLGQRVRLPANWKGREPGAERCAMHGLMLDVPLEIVNRGADRVEALFRGGDFGGHWLSRAVVRVSAEVRVSELTVAVTTENAGDSPLPVGMGWHPYFALPSGRREQARVHLPARRRAVVTNYDDVFPTGELAEVADTVYDFTPREGAALGSQYFDDCFVDLVKTIEGHTRVEIFDPAASYRLRLTSLSPHVRALQMYAPPDRPFVVIEPQFNLADPFSRVWDREIDTGMVVLTPGNAVTWAARWELL